MNRRVTSKRILGKTEKVTTIPSKSGYLQKWSPTFLVGWQQRYITLDNRILKYYKEDKG
jgi:hypothetical protein